jgi:pyruvate formate lyase activating enzyme
VLSIQRMSTEDGPGLRTTVFFKGCSLSCRWCQNPESLSPKIEIVWHDWKCIGAGRCDAVCRDGAIRRHAKTVEIDLSRCTLCGACTDECPTTALELLGLEWCLDDLVAEVAKDRSYFETSGGGITVSGGEPAQQLAFVAAFLQRCRSLGLHTALDTCGMCSASALETLAGCADLVLYDVKEIDAERHTRFTGQSNTKILSNLVGLGERMRCKSHPQELWIRTPLIPGATATDENILGIGAFLSNNLRGLVRRWELCAFNNLARDKYRRLGIAWDYGQTELLTAQELQHFAELARTSGVDPDIVVATGPTRAASLRENHD